MKYILLLFTIMALSVSNAQINVGGLIDKGKKALKGENPLSKDEIAAGLKQALDKGIGEAVSKLSAEDGYLESVYKIYLPEEAQSVISKVKMVPGFENVEKELILRMNRAAELAAKKASPIFIDAVKSISFDDAMNILKGEDNAATTYLSNKSRQSLYDEFMPIIASALDEVNARSYWKSATEAYNKIPFVKKVNTELDDHVNDQALDGLFGLIAVKEAGIRNDIDQRSSDLLRKVFAYQD